MQMDQLFALLDHWTQRQDSGLTPLIWNPSCDLLADTSQRSRPIRGRRQRQSNPDSGDESEEENFDNQLRNISDDGPESDHSHR